MFEAVMTPPAPKRAGPQRSALLGVAGLALIAWALVELRITIPEQADPVLAASPESWNALPPSSDPAVEGQGDERIVLYPDKPQLGEEMGTMTLPSLALSWPIFEGTSEAELQQGVGHFEASVLPGYRDNSVLSGHRTTVFGRLGELEKGDLVVVNTSAGVFTYKIRKSRVVSKADLTVIVPTESAVLTLTTCYPFRTPLPTTRIYVVSADLVDSNLATPLAGVARN